MTQLQSRKLHESQNGLNITPTSEFPLQQEIIKIPQNHQKITQKYVFPCFGGIPGVHLKGYFGNLTFCVLEGILDVACFPLL